MSYTLCLAEFLNAQYGITAQTIEPAQRGYYGETWQVRADEARYFVKIVSSVFHMPVYERSFAALDFLAERGVDCVSRVVKTLAGTLYARLDGATVGVFAWFDGETREDETTKPLEYDMLARVYAVSCGGPAIPCAAFATPCADMVAAYTERIAKMPGAAADKLLNALAAQREMLAERKAQYAVFAEHCSGNLSHFYITHGDAGGNIMIDGANAYIVDWDGVMAAPPERDAWFCLHQPWAMDLFHEALRRNGIAYTLRAERLAYFAYHSFFMYLAFYLQTFLEDENRRETIAAEAEDYLQNSWINENLRFIEGK